jgi:FKBP-type peptidyl-prolyl cis-trans isomerase
MRRRRVAALAITSLLAAAVTAGCGSSTSSSSAAASSSASPSSTADNYTSVTATGAFGSAPTVKIPDAAGSGSLYTKTLIQGSGAKLTTAQSLLGDFVLYDWSGKTHKLIGSTYSEGVPTLFTGALLPGLETALIGQKVGSRVLAVIPPADAFGSAGNSEIGVGAKDTVVFVVDMLKSFPNTEGVPGTQTSDGGGALPTVKAGAAGKGPTVTIPGTAAPTTLQVKTLIKGTGAVVKKGQYIVVQYTGVNWRTKKVFDSSWSRSEPWATVIGTGQVIKGWDTGLVGQTVGSRVLLVVPPADGYGKAGSSSAGIKGTDTLVFVIDIIAAA